MYLQGILVSSSSNSWCLLHDIGPDLHKVLVGADTPTAVRLEGVLGCCALVSNRTSRGAAASLGAGGGVVAALETALRRDLQAAGCGSKRAAHGCDSCGRHDQIRG